MWLATAAPCLAAVNAIARFIRESLCCPVMQIYLLNLQKNQNKLTEGGHGAVAKISAFRENVCSVFTLIHRGFSFYYMKSSPSSEIK